MKKVRYAIGAAGIAPALGLMLPSAAGAATQVPAQPATAPAVPPGHGKMVRAAAACTGRSVIHDHTGNFYISVWHTSSTACVGGVNASLRNNSQIGLVLRTRAYSYNGTEKTRWLSSLTGGAILNIPKKIIFYQGIHQVRPRPEQICEAIVHASEHAKVYAGPLCVSF
jgi:hypothetical protein